MKIIKYQLMTEIVREIIVPVPVADGDGEAVIEQEKRVEVEQVFSDCEIHCSDETFESNYAIALKEAYNGEVTVEEVEDETEPQATTEERLTDLEETTAQQGEILNILLSGETEESV